MTSGGIEKKNLEQEDFPFDWEMSHPRPKMQAHWKREKKTCTLWLGHDWKDVTGRLVQFLDNETQCNEKEFMGPIHRNTNDFLYVFNSML